jgi:hypothetical protein
MMNVMDHRRNTVPHQRHGRGGAAAVDNSTRNGEAQLQLLNILRQQLAQAAVQQLEPPSSLALTSSVTRTMIPTNKSLTAAVPVPVAKNISSPPSPAAPVSMSRAQVEQLIRSKYFGQNRPAAAAVAAVPPKETVAVLSLQKGLEQLGVGCDVTTADGSASTEKRSNKTSNSSAASSAVSANTDAAVVATTVPVVAEEAPAVVSSLTRQQQEVDSLKTQLQKERDLRLMYQERCEALEAHLSKVKLEAEAGLDLKKMPSIVAAAAAASSGMAATSSAANTNSPVAPANSRSFLRSRGGHRGSLKHHPRKTSVTSTASASVTAAAATATTLVSATSASSTNTNTSTNGNGPGKMNEYVDMFNDQSEHSAITFYNDASMSGRYFHSIHQESSTSTHNHANSNSVHTRGGGANGGPGFNDQSERTMINTYTQAGQGPNSNSNNVMDASGHSRMTTATASYGYSFHSRASEASTVLQPYQAALRKELQEEDEAQQDMNKNNAHKMSGGGDTKTPKSKGNNSKTLNRGGEIKHKPTTVDVKFDKLGHVIAGNDVDADNAHVDDDDYSTRTGDYGSQSSSIRSLDSMSSHSSDDDSDHEDSFADAGLGRKQGGKMSSAVNKPKSSEQQAPPSTRMMFGN